MDGVKFSDCKIGKYELNSVAVALDSKMKAYSFGDNQFGQLGHGDQRNRKLPT